jgi:hypothetical protein
VFQVFGKDDTQAPPPVPAANKDEHAPPPALKQHISLGGRHTLSAGKANKVLQEIKVRSPELHAFHGHEISQALKHSHNICIIHVR